MVSESDILKVRPKNKNNIQWRINFAKWFVARGHVQVRMISMGALIRKSVRFALPKKSLLKRSFFFAPFAKS